LEESNCTTIETDEEKSDSISLDQQSLSNIREIFNNFEKLFHYCTNLNDYLVKHQ